MLEQAVARFDALFTRALQSGALSPDPTLTLDNIEISPEIRALLEEARQAEAAEASAPPPRSDSAPGGEDSPATPEPTPEPTATVNNFAISVATPDAGAYDNAIANIRGTPGVANVIYTSTAVGGNSVMRVTYSGDLSALAAALRGRGWSVNEGAGGLGISR